MRRFPLAVAASRLGLAIGRPLLVGAFALGGLAAAPSARAANEVPVAGLSLLLDESPTTQRLLWSARDAAVRPDEIDPRAGSALLLGSSSAPGQCRIERPLDPRRWHRLGVGSLTLGWLHFDWDRGGGILALLLPGTILVFARGDPVGCEPGDPQRLPVEVELRAGGRRYCASFGGRVVVNEPGRLRLRRAPAPPGCPDADLTVADLNVLHGIGCGPDQCRLVDRMELLAEWLEARGCPDVVTLQEVAEVENFTPVSVREAILDALPGHCPVDYEAVYLPVSGLDEELVLSRYPVLESEVLDLHLGFYAPIRHVTRVRVDHPIGAVDVFTTHLASGSDLAGSPCENAFFSCPEECVAAGVTTVRQCEALQMALFVEARHVGPAPAVATGDFNARPGSREVAEFTDRGWIDAFLAVGNPECVPGTGVGCTSGRESTLAELESPDANVDERIDYVFVVPADASSACAGLLDGPGDDDGDGIATRLFAGIANPFAPACGPTPDPVCWPSDHVGVELDLDCAP